MRGLGTTPWCSPSIEGTLRPMQRPTWRLHLACGLAVVLAVAGTGCVIQLGSTSSADAGDDASADATLGDSAADAGDAEAGDAGVGDAEAGDATPTDAAVDSAVGDSAAGDSASADSSGGDATPGGDSAAAGD